MQPLLFVVISPTIMAEELVVFFFLDFANYVIGDTPQTPGLVAYTTADGAGA